MARSHTRDRHNDASYVTPLGTRQKTNETKCWKCGQLGHKGKHCTGEDVCSLCEKDGHSYFQCPASYSNKLKGTNRNKGNLQVTTNNDEGVEPEAQGDSGDSSMTSSSKESSHNTASMKTSKTCSIITPSEGGKGQVHTDTETVVKQKLQKDTDTDIDPEVNRILNLEMVNTLSCLWKPSMQGHNRRI